MRTSTAIAAAVLAAILVPVGCQLMSTATTVASAPGRVVQRTFGTDNILQNYEWFFDVNAQFNARTSQIKSHKALIEGESDPDELRRLRVELSGMQQSCRDLAEQYNANSQKQNRDLFKSRNLPATLECED